VSKTLLMQKIIKAASILLILQGVLELALLAYLWLVVIPTLSSVFTGLQGIGPNMVVVWFAFAMAILVAGASITLGVNAKRNGISLKSFLIFFLGNFLFFSLAYYMIAAQMIAPLYDLTNKL